MVFQDIPCMTQSIAGAAIGFFVAVLIMTYKNKKKESFTQKDVDKLIK